MLVRIALGFTMAVSSIAGCQPSTVFDRAAPFDGPLTGREMLVQLEDPSGKRPSGIYALDPFAENPEPKLLFRNGERPVWNPAHTYFAYLNLGSVFVARTDGRAWCVLSPLSTRWDRALRAPEAQLRWTADGTLLAVAVSDRIGQFTYLVMQTAPELPEDEAAVDWVLLPLPPVLALRKPISEHYATDVEWSDLLIVRDMDYAPNSSGIVVQEAPFLPYGLGNEHSKLYTYRSRSKAERKEHQTCFADTGMSSAWWKPERLTGLPDTVTEMAPQWSPDGEWVAFTAVNPEESWAGAFVARPDGSGCIGLWPPANAEGENVWLPPGPLPSVPFPAGWESNGWGQSNERPVEWSDDGRYLLVEIQRHFKSELIAQGADMPSGGHFLAYCQDGNWQLRAYSCRLSPGGSWPSIFDLVGGRAVLGPPVTEGALPSLAVYSPDSVAMRTAHDEGPGRTFDIGDSFRILWLDW